MNDDISHEEPSMKESMADAKAAVQDTVRDTKQKLVAKSKEVASQAKERGEEYVRQGKERAASRLSGVSDSIRHTAERFEQEHDPNIAHYTRLAADKIERAAAYVRERDLNQLRRDGEELARRYPAIFFGGMFVAGLAAARFLKASAEHDPAAGRFDGTEEETAAEAGDGKKTSPESEAEAEQQGWQPS